MWPTASRITTRVAERVGVAASARSWSITQGWSEPGDRHRVRLRRRRRRRAPAGRDDHRVGREREHRVGRRRRRRAGRRRRGARTRRRASRRSRRARRGPGSSAASRILPPRSVARSSSVTSWPRAAATHAASRPARPAADHDDPLARARPASSVPRPSVASRPTAGFVTQVIGQPCVQVAVAALVAAGAAADLVGRARRAPCRPTRDRRSARARA